MGWRDDLRTASWRGIECLYDGAEDDRGRRVVVHEYPLRNQPDVDDQGRKARRYRITLYLLASALGSTYTARRDQLIAALEKGGAGTLVHPYYGALDVFVEDFSPSYSTREGGRVTIACTFVEAGTAREPRASVRTDAVMREQAGILTARLGDDFVSQWVLDQVPGFVRDSAVAAVGLAREALAVKADVFDQIVGVRLGLVAPLNDGRRVFDGLLAGRDALSALGLPRIRKARRFRESLPRVVATTPSTQTQATNQNAVAAVVEVVAIAAAVDVVSRTVFDSVDEAITARDELLDQIDDQSRRASDPVFEALRDLRVALVADIRERGAGLPNVRTIYPQSTLPALVLAHRLYGDASRAADIVTRNGVAHPGFLAGGQPLEVLTDAA